MSVLRLNPLSALPVFRQPDVGRCPRCGVTVPDDEHAVLDRGYVYHAACALYQPR